MTALTTGCRLWLVIPTREFPDGFLYLEELFLVEQGKLSIDPAGDRVELVAQVG